MPNPGSMITDFKLKEWRVFKSHNREHNRNF